MRISRSVFAMAFLAISAAALAASAGAARADHASDFLVHGNVFNDRGFTVANARIRATRAGKTSWRWETASDSQGEFALHIPAGELYVLRADAKGYKVLTQNVDATQTDRADITLTLVQAAGGKSK